MLSASQLATLAELGEERTAGVGDVLFRVGDPRYPFIAIVEGEVAILDAAGNEIVRHGTSGFSRRDEPPVRADRLPDGGRHAAVALHRGRPRRLRPLLFEDGPLSDLLLSTFIARREALQQVQGVGLEIVGPRSSEATMRMVEFARSNRLPFTWRDPERADDEAAAALVAGLDATDLPLVRLPGGAELRGPSTGQVSRALGIGRELAPRGGRPGRGRRRAPRASAPPSTARPRVWRRSSSRARHSVGRRARPGGSRTTSGSRPGSPAPS